MRKSQLSIIKHRFFSSQERSEHFSFKENDFDLNQLHSEYSSLYQIFTSNKRFYINNLQVALYVDYICDLMISYYEHDVVNAELHKLYQQKKEIEAFIQVHASQEEHQPIHEFSEYLVNRLKNNLHEYKSSLSSITKIRTQMGDINSWRSQFNYSRALATQTINFLQNSQILQEINAILGNQFTFVEGLTLLNESREALAILGIVLFSFRFMINLILMIKHTIQAAMDKELSANKVLKQELEKRGFTMASDLVWSVVTLLTTYNNLFNISSLAVPAVVLCFLVFDVLLILSQYFLDAVKHDKRVQELISQKNAAGAAERIIIERQIDVLNDEWDAQHTYYAINILGGSILVTCFAISLMFTGPYALAAMALCSMLGNALYNTATEYTKYQKTMVAIRREEKNGKILDDAHHQELMRTLNKESSKQFREFAFSLAFNVGGIAFIITAAVISWPVALVLTASYIGYRLYKSYQKQRDEMTYPAIPHDIYRFFDTPEKGSRALDELPSHESLSEPVLV